MQGRCASKLAMHGNHASCSGHGAHQLEEACIFCPAGCAGAKGQPAGCYSQVNCGHVVHVALPGLALDGPQPSVQAYRSQPRLRPRVPNPKPYPNPAAASRSARAARSRHCGWCPSARTGPTAAPPSTWTSPSCSRPAEDPSRTRTRAPTSALTLRTGAHTIQDRLRVRFLQVLPTACCPRVLQTSVLIYTSHVHGPVLVRACEPPCRDLSFLQDVHSHIC